MANTNSLNNGIVSRCVDEILKKKTNDKPFLVAITGDSGSGKSYYSALIQKELERRQIQFSHINADDFLISRADREPMKRDCYKEGEFAGKSKWEVLENMFRLDEFHRVISELKLENKVRYTPYIRESGTISEEEKVVQPAGIIIFDSSMLIELMDYVILVDVNIETIISRKIIRDSDVRTPTQIEEMHRKVQGYYWSRRKPSRPDIVINNNDIDNPTIEA